MWRVSFRPCRSWCPTIAEPSPDLVQLPQVVSPPAVEYMPIGSEPVRMSCSFGVSPRTLTCSPFSVSAVSLLMLALAECRSATFFATITPLALYQGPLPMRSRAFSPGAPVAPAPGVLLRYACQLVRFEPAFCASALQCASAPSRPPRSAPLPLPTLVTKNDMGPFAAAFFSCACAPKASSSAAATIVSFMQTSPRVECLLTSRTRRLFPLQDLARPRAGRLAAAPDRLAVDDHR